MSVVEVSTEYGGRTLTLQTGKFAKQTDASVLVTYGDTIVLVTAVSSRTLKEGQSFFPLTVDFLEKYYSAGRMPGGFFKREAKPSDKATLSARMTDRPIRPLFPEDYMFETNIVATVLSCDPVNEPDFLAQIGASAALHLSDIPFNGPIAGCRVGYIDGEFVLNPTPEQQTTSAIDLLVSGGRAGVVMVEGKSAEVPEKTLLEAIFFAHEKMQAVLDLQDELRKKTGSKEKREYDKPPQDEKLKKELRSFLWDPFKKAFAIREKLSRYEALAKVKDDAIEKFAIEKPETKEEETKNRLIPIYIEELKATYARETTLKDKKRIDGRPYDAIRDISCEVGFLPRVHGSGLFQRGETQVLSTVTLGTSEDEQKIDAIAGAYQKTFLLHYNFPPYSVGEARPLRPPGRREVGHGFLAERALAQIVPSKEEFPYTVRVVAEVLESNGSSSMATVCSGSLALMDAGVPIKKAVAGVAMGMMVEGSQVAILSDILGDEDHLGDMDFKVCGTETGITAFQMDLKIGSITKEIMAQALEQARAGRVHILGIMNEVLAKPRENLSAYAPRIFTIKVKPDKVREVIGPGGKVVKGIIEKTGVKIDIEDDGTIHVASIDETSAKKAIALIEGICEEPEPGKIYEGKVTRIVDFGAFVEIIPGTEGLCHISELDTQRVGRVEDVVKEGEVIKVKCLEVDSRGKIRLSRRALMAGGDGPRPPRGDRGDRGERGDRGDRGDRSDRGERGERGDRGERSERGDRGDRGERRESRGERGGRDRDRDRGGRGRDRDRGGDRDRDRDGDRDRDRGRGSDSDPELEADIAAALELDEVEATPGNRRDPREDRDIAPVRRVVDYDDDETDHPAPGNEREEVRDRGGRYGSRDDRGGRENRGGGRDNHRGGGGGGGRDRDREGYRTENRGGDRGPSNHRGERDSRGNRDDREGGGGGGGRGGRPRFGGGGGGHSGGRGARRDRFD